MKNILEIVESKNRISLKENYEPIICGNTNYYFKFTFDDEWSVASKKQLIIEILGRKIILEIGEDNICKLPSFPNAVSCLVMVNCVIDENECYSSNALRVELEPNPMKESLEVLEPFSGYFSKLLSSVDDIANGKLSVKNSDYSTVSGRSETQVSLTGDENITGSKNFETEILKQNNIVPNINQISNPNLLINPEMLINQRGQNSYSGNNVYATDRWKLCCNEAYATKQDTGKWVIGISGATTSGAKNVLMQTIENFEKLKGKTITATISISDFSSITTYATLFIYDGKSRTDVSINHKNNLVSATYTVNENATTLCVGIRASYTNSDFSFIFNWCKLEIGNNPTMFSPKIYAQDFRDCQRFYQKLKLNGGASSASTASVIYCAFPVPVTMRTKPTIASYTIPSIRGNGEMFNASSISMNSIYDNEIVFTCFGGGNLKQYQIYALHNGEVLLDAEIY
ncbi:MAG: hypothetical protein IJX17_03780 [Clostridia bacterium]|nr:hypothetical protein [Clostridia bacterium]